MKPEKTEVVLIPETVTVVPESVIIFVPMTSEACFTRAHLFASTGALPATVDSSKFVTGIEARSESAKSRRRLWQHGLSVPLDVLVREFA
jgi:hypothetical protein